MVTRLDKGNPNWRLPENLAEKSQCQIYPTLLKEWEVTSVERLDKGVDSEQCLCTHAPIRKVCHISNGSTGETAIVGRCCVLKFENEPGFAGTHKVFDALSKIAKKRKDHANAELLNYAKAKNILTQAEYDKYMQIWRKRNLSTSEQSWLVGINQRILDRTSSAALRATQAQRDAAALLASVRPVAPPRIRDPIVARVPRPQAPVAQIPPTRPLITAPGQAAASRPPVITVQPPAVLPPIMAPGQSVGQMPHLKFAIGSPPPVGRPAAEAPIKSLGQLVSDLWRNLKTQNADPRLIQEAQTRGLLKGEELEFYQKMTNGRIYNPTEKQLRFRTALNYKIANGLQSGTNFAPQPTARPMLELDETTQTPNSNTKLSSAPKREREEETSGEVATQPNREVKRKLELPPN